jgi:hypothetical protein
MIFRKSVLVRATRRHMPEDNILRCYRRENINITLLPPTGDQGDSRVFHPEHGSDMFLRNVCYCKSHTASYARRRYSSLLPP